MSTIQHTIQRAYKSAYKSELDLNNEQITACKRHVGAARWACNGGLACEQEADRATSESRSATRMRRSI
jgi:putative transposase